MIKKLINKQIKTRYLIYFIYLGVINGIIIGVCIHG